MVMVVPAKMEINSLPSSAFDIPGAMSKASASCGLQLEIISKDVILSWVILEDTEFKRN